MRICVPGICVAPKTGRATEGHGRGGECGVRVLGGVGVKGTRAPETRVKQLLGLCCLYTRSILPILGLFLSILGLF